MVSIARVCAHVSRPSATQDEALSRGCSGKVIVREEPRNAIFGPPVHHGAPVLSNPVLHSLSNPDCRRAERPCGKA